MDKSKRTNKTIADLIKKTTQVDVSSQETAEAFEEKMTEIEIREKERATEDMAKEMGLPYINLQGFPIASDYLKIITKAQAQTLKIICFFKDPNSLKLAVIDPNNQAVLDLQQELKDKFMGIRIDVFLISEHSFNLAWQLYEHVHIPKQVKGGMEISEKDIEKFRREIKSFRQLSEKLRGANATQIFTIILAGAIQSESSDVHIETEQENVVVRYRIDGVLQNVATVNKEDWPKIISRIKLLAGLKLNIISVPQDGRISIFLTDDKIDVRVSTLPTAFGESIVMRLLMSSTAGIGFEKLGITGAAHDQIKLEVEKPNGMIITTGPTGSGKTTTLYSFLEKLNTPETKIITLEDPIEYQIKGINQSQVDHSKGYDFSRGLRSILRQDPDIIMVGEIRDFETAEISIQAALTGHLVFSTLHTNDSCAAINRLVNMGIEPFLISSSVIGVLAQRLVRTICSHCKEEYKPTKEALKDNLEGLDEIRDTRYEIRLFKGKGCKQCMNSGYKGRAGIFELLVVDDNMRSLIAAKASVEEIRKKAVEAGMVGLKSAGMELVKQGVTTVEEVLRVAEDV